MDELRDYEPEGDPWFIGVEAFKQLYNLGRIQPEQVVEVIQPYRCCNDLYSVTSEGNLQHIVAEGFQKYKGFVEPGAVLSEEKAPDGWMVAMLFPAQGSLN